MRNNLQNDVKIEKSRTYQSKFDLSGSVSNTANIGEVNVLFSRTLQPYSKAMCGTEQLVRMAPLVAPTYAKQHYKTWHMFVPIQDIWQNYAPFMTKQSVSRNGEIIHPIRTPFTAGWHLAYWCLNGAKASIYVAPVAPNHNSAEPILDQFYIAPYPSSQTWYRKVVDYVVSEWMHAERRGDGSPVVNLTRFVPQHYMSGSTWFLESGNYVDDIIVNDSYVKHNPALDEIGLDELTGYDVTDVVPLGSADYTLFTEIAANVIDGTDCKYRIAIAFRFSSWGSHLAKVLRGLGYPIDLDDTTYYNILPLVATYRAYWDIFGLEQWQNYESTYASRLQSLYETVNEPKMSDPEFVGVFNNFIRNELGAMWVTEKKDYISAHLPQPTIATANEQLNASSLPIVDVVDIHSNTGINATDTNTMQTPGQPSNALADGHSFIERINHGYLDSELMKRWYKRTNVKTALGQSIKKQLLAMGQGDFVKRCKCHYIGDTDVVIDVTSVTSASDTFDSATKQGKLLGSYSGKGVGYSDGKKKLWYNSGEEMGYWIALDAVTVDAGYSQGVDLTLMARKSIDFPQADYDGLGLELHPKSVVNGSRDIGTNAIHLSPSMSTKSFGFATHYSAWKVGRNCLNGGFAQKSTRQTFVPYNMDKLIYPDDLETWRNDLPLSASWFPSLPSDSEGYLAYTNMTSAEVPTAGNAWSYLGRFYWLANLLRIFAQEGKKITYMSTRYAQNQSLAPYFEYHVRVDDNYILLTDVWFKAWMPMLPIEETYGTVDPDKKQLEYIERC